MALSDGFTQSNEQSGNSPILDDDYSSQEEDIAPVELSELEKAIDESVGETVADEPVVEETVVEDAVVEETVVEETVVEEVAESKAESEKPKKRRKPVRRKSSSS